MAIKIARFPISLFFFGLLGLQFQFLFPCPATAQEPSTSGDALFDWDLALVRKLRDSRDFDTAIALLEKLVKEHPLKANLLAFEQARTLVDQAALEPDPIYRERQRRQARQD